ncbi:hypothetical protein SD15574_4995 [Shigella dysenteriae 155-74]|nr:hypothetical protein SD15574_4995 [Shigella dysenteriae 155-74]
MVICFDLAIDQIAQSGLSSLKVIYYSAQLFSAYADLAGRVNINEYNNNYLTAQFEELSQRDMKKYLGEMKRLADGGEMNFDDYLEKMSLLVNEGTLDPDILSKMRDAAPQLISFAKSFDPTSKEEIKILTDTSKLIYDLFGVKSEK